MLSHDERRGLLAQQLSAKRCLRVIEAHSPISALVAEDAKSRALDGRLLQFDAMWSSSLTDSTHRGLPDIEFLNTINRLQGVQDIFNVSKLPLIFDGDTGGQPEHFIINIKMLERAGVSAVVIEDKCGLKRNSLLGNDVDQKQESIEAFCEKIEAGCQARSHSNFMIMARCESLILDRGMDDALKRCLSYVQSGANGIMIHSRKKDGAEVLDFARLFRSHHPNIPLICVPTSYAHVHINELEEAGFNIVIYANHMLRGAYLAMRDIAQSILLNGRTCEIEPRCLAIDHILTLIPGTSG
jgi:phosphoenolpyruvate phosphomutase